MTDPKGKANGGTGSGRAGTTGKPVGKRQQAGRKPYPGKGGPTKGAPRRLGAGPFARGPAKGRPQPTPAPSSGLSIGARRLALDVLRDVHQEGAYAGLALNERLKGSPLKPADRRLATSILYGTIENQIQIDFALDQLMSRPTNELLQRDILRLSAYQILFLDRVPDSAAVNEGVNLAKALGMENATGFLNAVLRNLVRGKETLPWPKREEDLLQFLHIMGSMPKWLVQRLVDAYGPEEAEAIIMHRPTSHPIVVRPNMLRQTDEAFAALLERKAWQVKRGIAPHAFLVQGAAEISLDMDYRGGLFSIQGQSSMLAAEAVQAKPGMRILDACAAPGGKSAYLCETMQNTGRVFAWELHEKRTQLLESTKRRLGLDNLRISQRDATQPKPDMEGTLDAVLLDAPCSGLGVLAQKPDVKYRLQEEDLPALVQQQQLLLEALCGYVKPGGLMVYSTCSLLPEENRNQVEGFLQRHPEYSIEALPASFPEALRQQEGPLGLQLLGNRDDVEGFYMARLRKARR